MYAYAYESCYGDTYLSLSTGKTHRTPAQPLIMFEMRRACFFPFSRPERFRLRNDRARRSLHIKWHAIRPRSSAAASDDIHQVFPSKEVPIRRGLAAFSDSIVLEESNAT